MIDSFGKLTPGRQVRKPVRFVVYVGSILTTLLWIQAIVATGEAPTSFTAQTRMSGVNLNGRQVRKGLSRRDRRLHQGVDVVVGYIETHGRAETDALLAGLEILPARMVAYRGTTLREFDLDAGLARRPAVILVDELAHTNAPGSRHAKRWQDVLELLDAGINVYTTLNVQHVESLNEPDGAPGARRREGDPSDADRVPSPRHDGQAPGQGHDPSPAPSRGLGPPAADQAHYLHVYMAQLRRKIEADPARPRHLLTEPGIGYRLAAD